MRTLREFHAALAPTLRARNRKSTAPSRTSESYEAARNYHFNRTPPIEYLVAVSRAFGVRLEWLATGQEPRTEDEAERARISAIVQQAAQFQQDQTTKLIRHLPLGEGAPAQRRDAALWRFLHKLNDAKGGAEEWWQPARPQLLRAALEYLLRAEEALVSAGAFLHDEAPHEPLDPQVWSDARYVTWADGTLALFWNQLPGLGLRRRGAPSLAPILEADRSESE